MEDTVKLAVEAEKTFNNCNQLLLTLVDDHILVDQLKNVHKSVKNVKVLQPRFVPQTRYIVEVADIDDVPSVMNTLMEHNFKGKRVQIKLLDHNGYLDLDPYKLEVKNLPPNISNCDLKQLFPLSTGYKLSSAETNASTITVIVHFENVKDAISSFKTMHLINYKDNVLSIKFVRRNVNDSLNEETNPHAKKRPNADHFDNERIKSEGNEEVNIPYRREIEHNAQANTQITDTLIVHNLPSTMEEKQILTLFPSLCRYKFLYKTTSKSCIIRFKTAPEAVAAYTNCEKIYMSRIMQVDFYDKEIDESAHRASKIARFRRDKATNQQQSEKIAPIPNDYISFENNLKKEFEPHSENQEEDSLTLRVKNLPSNTTKEDLRQLFPKHCKCQLKVEKTEDCASALIHFLTTTAANNACKSMQNKPFRGHVLSINFKSKPVKVNPFAASKANNSTFDSSTAQNDTPVLRSSTYVLTDLNGDFVAEDDVECKSEDNYSIEGDFDVNSDTNNDYESDEEYQGKDLTGSILRFDED